jgi:putative transposase
LFLATTVQTFIVHLIRHSLKYVPRRQYAPIASDLKAIYTAIDAEHAAQEFERFNQEMG